VWVCAARVVEMEDSVRKRNAFKEDGEKEKVKFNLTDGESSEIESATREQTVIRKARLRRHNSVSNALGNNIQENRTRTFQVDRPIHQHRDSILSMNSGFWEFDGAVNNCLLLLSIGGIRLLLENIIKYGLRVNPFEWVFFLSRESRHDGHFHTPLWLLGTNLHLLFAFYLEKALATQRVASWLGFYLHTIQLLVIIVSPWLAFNLWPHMFSLVGRMLICTLHIIMLLKVWSYCQVNHWCREEMLRRKRSRRGRSMSFRSEERITEEPSDPPTPAPPVTYPHNLTLSDLYYFMAAPTLCYELNFPRTTRIRKWFLARRALEVVLLSNLLLALFQQWIIPSVRNSMKPFSEMDYIRTWERLLKLSVPNHLLWVMWFYLVFHSGLNTVGELMRFADRKFYLDWWNAPDVGTFWRLWNLPVHHWCFRHLYTPVIRAGYNRTLASTLVFLLSAFLHEYVVSVPLQMFKVLAFVGMCMQIPLISFSAWLSKRFGWRWGNLLLWASLILGQPLCILVYFYDYAVLNLDLNAV